MIRYELKGCEASTLQEKDFIVSLTLAQFNDFDQDQATSALLTCCTSSRWAHNVASARPFETLEALIAHSDTVWSKVQQQESDLLEALDGHPQIGNVATLKEKYRNTADSANMTTKSDFAGVNQIGGRIGVVDNRHHRRTS